MHVRFVFAACFGWESCGFMCWCLILIWTESVLKPGLFLDLLTWHQTNLWFMVSVLSTGPSGLLDPHVYSAQFWSGSYSSQMFAEWILYKTKNNIWVFSWGRAAVDKRVWHFQALFKVTFCIRNTDLLIHLNGASVFTQQAPERPRPLVVRGFLLQL